MRNIIVAVHGGNGVGKTTFSAALARSLSAIYNGVLVISPDIYNPAYASMLPEDHGEQIESLGRISDNPYFGTEFVQTILTPLPTNDAIGILGYCKDENAEKYNLIEENIALRLLETVRQFAEVTIVDCSNPHYDNISHMALLNADVVFTLIQPDIKGIGWYNANKTVITQCDDGHTKHCILASPTHIEAPTETVSGVMHQAFFDILPFGEEPYQKLNEGRLFSKYNSKYAIPVTHCAEIVKEVKNNG